MRKRNTTASNRKRANGGGAYCAETIRQVAAFSMRRSNAKNVEGENKRYSNVITDGSRTIRVAEYSGRLLESPAA